MIDYDNFPCVINFYNYQIIDINLGCDTLTKNSIWSKMDSFIRYKFRVKKGHFQSHKLFSNDVTWELGCAKSHPRFGLNRLLWLVRSQSKKDFQFDASRPNSRIKIIFMYSRIYFFEWSKLKPISKYIYCLYVIDYFSLSKMSNFWKWVILMSHIHLQVISDEWKVSERFSMYG